MGLLWGFARLVVEWVERGKGGLREGREGAKSAKNLKATVRLIVAPGLTRG